MGTPADEARSAEVDAVCTSTCRWAEATTGIEALLLVGSWARGEARMDSDVDLVVVTIDAQPFLEDEDWVTDAVGESAPIVRTGDWGVLIERRVRLGSGLDVEIGFVQPSWAATDPVDPGTARVVSDGCRPLYDPNGLLTSLIAAVDLKGQSEAK